MEYLFLFTYSVIAAVIVGLALAAMVALFSKKNKAQYFRRTFAYTTLAVCVYILFLVFVN